MRRRYSRSFSSPRSFLRSFSWGLPRSPGSIWRSANPSSTARAPLSARACSSALALFLSTVFDDLWLPLLLTFCAALATVGLSVYWLPEGRGLFAAMGGRSYFFGGSVLWLELALCVAATAALIYAAAANVARRDF